MAVRSGWLNKRVRLQVKSVTRAENGEEIAEWIDLVTDTPDHCVWASIMPLRGREFFAAAQMQGAVDCKITIRCRADVTRAMRVLHGNAIYTPTADPINVGSKNETLELMCVTGIRDE